MTGRITIVTPAYERAHDDVQHTYDELARGCRELSREAAELFAGGWRGAAAREYARAWQEWEHQADQVLGALARLSAAMGVAQHELADTDTVVAEGAQRLHARLGV